MQSNRPATAAAPIAARAPVHPLRAGLETSNSALASTRAGTSAAGGRTGAAASGQRAPSRTQWSSSAAERRRATSGGTGKIIGRDSLADDLIAAAKSAADAKTSCAIANAYASWKTNVSDVTLFDAATGAAGVNLDGSAAVHGTSGANGGAILVGGKGDDTLNGSKGNDLIIAGDGKNTLKGGGGTDLLIGGSGSDTYVWSPSTTGGLSARFGSLPILVANDLASFSSMCAA